jgi:hypothetical protein
MEAAPASSFEVVEADLLLEVLIVALDAPAQLGPFDQTRPGDVLGQGREPVAGRLALAVGPLDEEPFDGSLGKRAVAMGR